VAAKRVAGTRGDPCGAPHVSPPIPATCFAATTPGMIYRILNPVFFK